MTSKIDLQAALRKLYAMHQFNVKLGLESIEKLMTHLGNPHKKFESLHIAGSNGKGSTASFMASILTEAGYRTALYTSPHFVRFNERVRIDGEEIPDDYIAEFIHDLTPYIDKHEPTFFEITTALAFKYFAESNLDYAVLETGLGGRLDATNVVAPQASVITSISHEHTNILGTDIKKIAYEKGGIIKKGVPLFLGRLPKEAIETLTAMAGERESRLYKLDDYIEEGTDSVAVRLDGSHYNIYETSLRGYHQKLNLGLAVLTLNKMLILSDYKVLNAGNGKIVKNTGIQGRYEVVNGKPRVIFDSAHNLDGLHTFINEFRKEREEHPVRKVIFGAMEDKDIAGMIKLLNENFDEILFAAVDYQRAVPPGKLKEIANGLGINGTVNTKPDEYITEFIKQNNNGCLAVLGSIYLLGEIKKDMAVEKT